MVDVVDWTTLASVIVGGVLAIAGGVVVQRVEQRRRHMAVLHLEIVPDLEIANAWENQIKLIRRGERHAVLAGGDYSELFAAVRSEVEQGGTAYRDSSLRTLRDRLAADLGKPPWRLV